MTLERPPVSVQRVIFLSIFGFFLMASYGAARPSVDSLLITRFSADALPYAWLGVAVLATTVVAIYNRFSPGKNLLRVFSVATLTSAVVLIPLLVWNAHLPQTWMTLGLWGGQLPVPGASYALYLWKDVYIVVLIEIFWSYANLTFPIKSARWIYGVFLAVGSFGGTVGNLVAARVGADAALMLVCPLLFVLGVVPLFLVRFEPNLRLDAKSKPSLLDGARVIRSSRYLFAMLLLIVVIQVVINLIEYQFNGVVEMTYPTERERTRVIGEVFAVINMLSLGLQLSSGVFLRYLGVSATLLAIPVLLGSAVLAFMIVPRVLTMAIARVASKAFDYSLFRAGKEILYIPLDKEQKTQGKAVIDMMVYRVAKGGASILLITLERIQATGWVGFVNLALVAVWVGLTWTVVSMFRSLTRSES